MTIVLVTELLDKELGSSKANTRSKIICNLIQ